MTKNLLTKRAVLLASALCLSALLPLTGCKPDAEKTDGGASPGAAATTGASASPDAGASPDASASPAGGVPASASAFEKPRKADGNVSVQIVTNNASNFWIAMERGMEAGVKETPGVAAKRTTPPGATPTNNDQKAAFEQALASNADGIAVSPISADAFAPVIDKAVDSGIPVICFDSDAPKSKRLAYIGTNNYEAGRRAGEAALKILPNGGKMVAFVGNMSAQNANDRYKGFVDATKGKIEMLQEPFQDNGDKTGRAVSNVKDAITKYGDKINGFLGIYSYNGPAIVQAVQSAGIRDKVKIVCFDGDPQTLKNLQTKTVDATVVQKPYEFGRLSTKMLYLVNRKGYSEAVKEMTPELEKAGMTVNGAIIDTGVEVITPENIAPFMARLKKLGLETT